jgi:predicted AAA+ superfamily ATPase
MLQRTLGKTIHKISGSYPVILITGPRQVGKTTLLEMCAEQGRNYVTLDDLQERTLAQTDPALFLQTHPTPLTIDEVQYAPELFSAIKLIVDRDKKPGQFWLTGSQKFHLMKGITESLAGRVAILDLLGLSRAELDGRADTAEPFVPTQAWILQARKQAGPPKNILDVYQRIWLGAFPKLNLEPDFSSRDIFYRSYVQTYIQRDVKDILSITNDVAFNRFLGAVAARTGQLLNFSDLSRDVDIDHKTAKSWLSVLETSGLVYLLQPYYANVTKRLVKTPKLYFLDTGLCSYLTQWPNSKSLETGAMSGAMLETHLFSEILKSHWYQGLSARNFYYYRDTDQREIDLVIESGEGLYPVEFKKTASPSRTASKHFHVLEKFAKPVGHGAVLCFVEKDIPLSREVTAVPVGYL